MSHLGCQKQFTLNKIQPGVHHLRLIVCEDTFASLKIVYTTTRLLQNSTHKRTQLNRYNTKTVVQMSVLETFTDGEQHALESSIYGRCYLTLRQRREAIKTTMISLCMSTSLFLYYVTIPFVHKHRFSCLPGHRAVHDIDTTQCIPLCNYLEYLT